MKKLLLLALLVAGCDTTVTKDKAEVGFVVYNVKHNGHDFLYFQRKSATPSGVTHDPDCEKCANEKTAQSLPHYPPARHSQP